MNQAQTLGALLILLAAGLAAWVAAGVVELLDERREKTQEPEPEQAPRPPIVWPERPEWAIPGNGRHRKEA